nr:hypothetical protein [uncultured Psychroserpens sp.]
MRTTLIFCALIFIFSCNKDKTIEDYYYSSEGYDIFKFDNEESKIIHLRDSTVELFTFKIWDEGCLEINGINYFYKNYQDSLILLNYYDRKLVLKKFDLEDIKIEDLNNKNWIMHVKKSDNYYNTTFIEKQIIRINDSLNAYYIKDNDTILGETYQYSKNNYNDFSFFKTSYSYVIPIELNSNKIKILLINGALNNTYTLNKKHK